MSFKIVKERKIQEWIDKTKGLIKITLMGKTILDRLKKFTSSIKGGNYSSRYTYELKGAEDVPKDAGDQ